MPRDVRTCPMLGWDSHASTRRTAHFDRAFLDPSTHGLFSDAFFGRQLLYREFLHLPPNLTI